MINAPYPELLKLFGKALIGISTMVDEHFGINVVEFMVCPLTELSVDMLLIKTGFTGGRSDSTGACLWGAIARHCRAL